MDYGRAGCLQEVRFGRDGLWHAVRSQRFNLENDRTYRYGDLDTNMVGLCEAYMLAGIQLVSTTEIGILVRATDTRRLRVVGCGIRNFTDEVTIEEDVVIAIANYEFPKATGLLVSRFSFQPRR